MGFERRRGCRPRPIDRQLRETLMGAHELLAIGEFRHHQPAIAIGLVVEVGMGGEQPRRAAGGDQRGVEALVQRVEFWLALAEAARVPADIALEAVERGDDFPFPGAVARFQAQAQRLPLDQSANADDVGEILARNRLDAKSALADRVDEAARGEPRKRLAHRRRADAVTRRRIRDAEPAAGREHARQYVRLDPRGGALAQRIRREGRRFVPVHGTTSFETSIGACNMSCCFIVSSHHPKSLAFRAGCVRLAGLILTSSIGSLVNFATASLVFSRSELTMAAASSIAARKSLTTSGFFSAKARVET